MRAGGIKTRKKAFIKNVFIYFYLNRKSKQSLQS